MFISPHSVYHTLIPTHSFSFFHLNLLTQIKPFKLEIGISYLLYGQPPLKRKFDRYIEYFIFNTVCYDQVLNYNHTDNNFN
jgi:hypothetical protein